MLKMNLQSFNNTAIKPNQTIEQLKEQYDAICTKLKRAKEIVAILELEQGRIYRELTDATMQSTDTKHTTERQATYDDIVARG